MTPTPAAPPTSDGAAMLAGIIANPADDTARLVYADWLQEQGQEERAEFIRVQIELALWERRRVAGGSHTPEPQKWCELHARMEAALGPGITGQGSHRVNGWEWFARYFQWAEYHAIERGFVSEVTCTAADWLTYGDAIRREHPVTRVTLTSRIEAFPFTARTPTAPATFVVTGWDASGYAARDANGLNIRLKFPLPPELELEGAKWKLHELKRWTHRLLTIAWPGVEFELPRVNAGAVIPEPTLPPLVASPELLDAMAVAGLEEQEPVTPEEWQAVWNSLLTPYPGTLADDGTLPHLPDPPG